jgi:hypothetical protein
LITYDGFEALNKTPNLKLAKDSLLFIKAGWSVICGALTPLHGTTWRAVQETEQLERAGMEVKQQHAAQIKGIARHSI